MISAESRDFRRLAASVRGLDKEVKKDLNKRIRTVAEPIAREVRNSAMGLPAGTGGKRVRLGKKKLESGERLGLRAGLAAATEIRIRHGANPGVRIVISQSKFQQQTGKYRSLPRYVEGLASSRRTPWRHPVFATKGKVRGTWEGAWAAQKPHPFLLPTVLPHKNKVRNAILEQYQSTFRRLLERHGIKMN